MVVVVMVAFTTLESILLKPKYLNTWQLAIKLLCMYDLLKNWEIFFPWK